MENRRARVLPPSHLPSGFHNYCPAESLEWSSRRPRILEELAAYDSDIVCLQARGCG